MAEASDKRTVPYTKGATITNLFDIIENKKAPPAVDGEWAKSLDLEPNRPSSVPNLFRWLGVTDEDNAPDAERWEGIRHADTRAEELTRLIRDAYSALFEATEAEKESREQLKREFARVYELGDATERVTCFLKLCEVAGMEMAAQRGTAKSSKAASPSTSGTKTAADQESKKKTAAKRSKEPVRTLPPARVDGASFVVSLNVEIPANWSQEQIVERLRTVQRAVDLQ